MSAPPGPARQSAPGIPLGVVTAAGLSVVVGVVSLIAAAGIVPALLRRTPPAYLSAGVDLAAALLPCAAAVVLWHRRRRGAWLLALAWALPTAFNVAAGEGIRLPSLFLVLAYLTLALNWHRLH